MAAGRPRPPWRAECPLPLGAAPSVHLGSLRWVGDGVSACDGQRRAPSDPPAAGAGRAPCVEVGRRGNGRAHGAPFARRPPRDTHSCGGDGQQGPDGGHLGECLRSCPRAGVCTFSCPPAQWKGCRSERHECRKIRKLLTFTEVTNICHGSLLSTVYAPRNSSF